MPYKNVSRQTNKFLASDPWTLGAGELLCLQDGSPLGYVGQDDRILLRSVFRSHFYDTRVEANYTLGGKEIVYGRALCLFRKLWLLVALFIILIHPETWCGFIIALKILCRFVFLAKFTVFWETTSMSISVYNRIESSCFEVRTRRCVRLSKYREDIPCKGGRNHGKKTSDN